MIWARDRSRKKNYILKSEPFEIFINNSVNSLSLLLCYSSSNSVHLCILIRLCCLIFFANIYLYLLLPLTWSLHDLCVLSPSIISGRLLHTPYNSKYKIKIQNTHSNWGGGGGSGVSILKHLAILAQGRVLGAATNWCFLFFCSWHQLHSVQVSMITLLKRVQHRGWH